MSDSPRKFKLDRSTFQARNASQQINYGEEYRDLTWQERMRVHKYLNSIANGYDLENPPRMDKNKFNVRSL